MSARERTSRNAPAHSQPEGAGPLLQSPALTLQQRAGNQIMERLLRAQPGLEPPYGVNETQARRGEIPRPTAADPAQRLLAGGHPLPLSIRKPLEERFAQNFAPVRIHSDSEAADSARALRARAFTIGEDVVFGAGHYSPATPRGQALLAHELTHVVQQRRSGPSIARQGNEEPLPAIPSFHLSNPGLTFFPGPWRSGVLGSPIPLPGSLRLTNALSVGTGPAYVLDLNPHQFVGTVLGELTLTSSTRAGTPEDRTGDPDAQQRIRLRNTILRLDPSSGRIRGTATMVVGTEYPEHLKAPMEIDVQIESTELGTFTGSLGYGPLHADFRLTLTYDSSRLASAVSPVFAPGGGFAGFWARLQAILRSAAPGINLTGSTGDSLSSLVTEVLGGRLNGRQFAMQTLELLTQSIPATADLAALRTSLSELVEEITHPGFRLTGGLGLGPLPLSRFSITAPTTRPLDRPLLGAPTAFPSTIGAYGTVIAPAGSITQVPVPAFGGLYSRFNERSGFSAIGGLLPTLSPESISAGRPFAAQFPVYLFAEVSYVRRVTGNLDLGVRVSGQLSTPQFLAPPAPSTDPVERFRETHRDYLNATGPTQTLTPPNIGVTIFGRFGGPF